MHHCYSQYICKLSEPHSALSAETAKVALSLVLAYNEDKRSFSCRRCWSHGAIQRWSNGSLRITGGVHALGGARVIDFRRLRSSASETRHVNSFLYICCGCSQLHVVGFLLFAPGTAVRLSSKIILSRQAEDCWRRGTVWRGRCLMISLIYGFLEYRSDYCISESYAKV